MPITRNPNNVFGTIELTDRILEVPNTSSFLKSKNIFTPRYTNQMAVMFDKDTIAHTLLPSVNRRGGSPSRGVVRGSKVYTLPLAYYNDVDTITKADYENKRRTGTADQNDTLANITAEKLMDQRTRVDETHEYMQLQAIKGNCKTPDGTSIANMFSEFGISQTNIDFLLGTSGTDVKKKCAAVKTAIQAGLKTGSTLSGNIPVLCDRSFFDKLIDHSSVEQAFLNSQSNRVYQDLQSQYLTFGITDSFVFQGLEFMVYEKTFDLPDGTTEASIATDTGHCVPMLANSIFKAFYGPSKRMDVDGGSEMFAWRFEDPRQTYHDVEVESACLFYCEKPAALVKVHTSN